MKKIYTLALLSFTAARLLAQQCPGFPLVVMSAGTQNVCDIALQDAGGGGPYPDQNITMTLCPATPGDVIQLSFSAFALSNPPGQAGDDQLLIFDGPDTGAPSLGGYGGSDLQGLDVTATIFNASGCLTLVFQDNGAANTTSPGFECCVTCTTPCDPPTAASAITSPTPDDPIVQSVGVCSGTAISFSGAGSTAGAGFNIANYHWNFDDGTTGLGQNVSHTFDEPGEYIVTLTIEDNNLGDDATGCYSLNIIPLQILVSTTPLFPGIFSAETCFPEQVVLQAVTETDTGDGGDDDGTLDIVSPTWTALPPQVVAGETYLADGAGFSYTTCLEFDFFEDGAVLENCDDLLSVFVNMEHSYMGDLGVFITCPDGTMVSLVEWGVNGGGGTFLGEAIDNENTEPGVGYDYYWSPAATNGTWGENLPGGFGGSLPSDTYEAYGDLCDLVGCPLNGDWCFSVTDNLAIDNGYIFAWGLNLNPALYPDVTTFTPQIGQDADSSYWSGPNIDYLSWDADTAYITPPAAGIYDYTYTVLNDFGCQFDTTISVEWTVPLVVTAGPDQLFSCGAVQLQGGFVGMAAPSCGADAGIFNYCYGESENFAWTFCPDDPGDGISFMTFSFISGLMENGFEDLTIYDGDDTGDPILAFWSNGNATGQSWTATNPTGCITIGFTSDGSVSCGGGSYTSWTYEVSCTEGGPDYTFEWTPSVFLDNANIPSPNVTALPQTTTFTLVGYPTGHPECNSSDDVEVNIDPLGDPGQDNTITICNTDAPFDMLGQLLGAPVLTGVWLDAAGAQLPDGNFDPTTDAPGDYTYSVAFGNCEAHAILTIQMALPTELEISADTSICEFTDFDYALLEQQYGQPGYSYQWSYDGTAISSSPSGGSHTPLASGTVC
ncbi:MAG: PKD domain-containing protein, partial [Flavobacteriales bacterium]